MRWEMCVPGAHQHAHRRYLCPCQHQQGSTLCAATPLSGGHLYRPGARSSQHHTSHTPSPCLLGRAGCCAARTCGRTGIPTRVTPSHLHPGDAAEFGADGREGDCCQGTLQGSSNPARSPGLSQAVPTASRESHQPHAALCAQLPVPRSTAFRIQSLRAGLTC